MRGWSGGDGLEEKSFEKKKSFFLRWKKWILRGLYGSIGFIVLVVTCDQVVMPLYVKHGKDVVLPSVIGKPFPEAQKFLKDRGFHAILDREAYNSDYPQDEVTFQNPFPESIVKKGRRVYLTISKGEKRVSVPKLVGGSERDAGLKLQRLSLKVGKKNYEFSTYYPRGVVMSQSVSPGDTLQVGQSVDFTVSLGEIPEHFIVPQLVGKSLKEATYILLHDGLKVGRVSREANDNLLPDTVIRQSFPAGTEVEMGQSIDLVVSEFQAEEKDTAAQNN